MTQPDHRPSARLLWRGLCLWISLGLAACTLGPDFARPPPPAVSAYGEDPKLAASTARLGGELPGQWWTLFKSKPLAALMEQAIRNNPDLQSAQAALLRAHENAQAQRGGLWPSLDANSTAIRQQVAPLQFGNPDNRGLAFNLFDASLGLSYTLDVFGLLRRQIEGLEAQAQFQRFQLEAAFLTLTANIVAAAVQEAAARAQIAATESMVGVQAGQLAVVERQFAAGAVAKAAVLAQQLLVRQTQATLPPLRRQLEQARNRLKALVGEFPDRPLPGPFTLEELVLPDPLPLSLPSKLVEQRPDLRAQEAMLHVASAQIGAVIASAFPNFTLQANLTTIATQAGNLFVPGSEVWNLTANLAQPIFQGGRLAHQRAAARAAYQQAAAEYRGSVVRAFQEVADVLAALRQDEAELAAQRAAEQAALANWRLTQAQFAGGAIGYLESLAAQNGYQRARLAVIAAQSRQLGDAAGLFVALGGGWWQRPGLAEAVAAAPRP